ncbi:gas vesicle protein GvpG [Rhodobacter capsulatus]|jgi:PHD/YefM family antitoxin component YafN of YafNO toxin-antitoxin module|uniref:Gas vesicle protein GvpG n=1 Tax=Rhodobacter capsulatus (strain ATCC BAA-309 / NBRC 16581 / SB1003) TaxID=272942 RepID=D5AR11_RHOCB|nr:gas vesicle protein GvpG [Rhodobacter capsulatus]ADE84817.1 gas vesicle protein GvpG [Rhodobacter capsulatus SB 1003]ETD02273.1 gas vesicle protein [Rhodobacter capsulatus DE442]ETD78356.1 gas vesicle protein [Rhodobacter capsulatus R121]ETD81124.1 gas vesicle protein [Rhodobacter capsulatus B6]ETE54471.1 gas vesicle protein [Rhodobacter capsulatus Y262]
MGLLRKLLLAPVELPITGALWIVEKIAETAESELTDPGTVRRLLRGLEQQLEAGEITEEEYEFAEEILLDRLKRGQAAEARSGGP